MNTDTINNSSPELPNPKRHYKKRVQDKDEIVLNRNKQPLENTNDILNLAFNKYQTAAQEEYTEVASNVENLQGLVSEFLTDFTIIGHTVLGQRVVIRFAKNSKDYDALSELTKKTLIKMFMDEQQQPF